jgi:hypothetical protein
MIDLHIHSYYSDGTYSPKMIADIALQKSLRIFSITDHDNVSALDEAAEYVRDKRIIFVSGIEMSTRFDGMDIHLLGYFMDHKNKSLLDTLSRLRNSRSQRAEKIVELLNQKNIDIGMKDVLKISGEGSVGRVHIAKALHEKKYVKSISDAFDRFLVKGSPYYVSKEVLEFGDAVNLLKASGGITVLAHPGLENVYNRLNELINFGLDGIEVYHPQNKTFQIKTLKKYATKNNLLITGGSDYHGANSSKHGCRIGEMPIPDSQLEKIVSEFTLKSKIQF